MKFSHSGFRQLSPPRSKQTVFAAEAILSVNLSGGAVCHGVTAAVTGSTTLSTLLSSAC